MSNKPDTPNGDGYAHDFDRRLDRINGAIQLLSDANAEDRRLFHDTMVEMHNGMPRQWKKFVNSYCCSVSNASTSWHFQLPTREWLAFKER